MFFLPPGFGIGGRLPPKRIKKKPGLLPGDHKQHCMEKFDCCHDSKLALLQMKKLRKAHRIRERCNNLLLAVARKQKGLPLDRPRLQPRRDINSFRDMQWAAMRSANALCETGEICFTQRRIFGAIHSVNRWGYPLPAIRRTRQRQRFAKNQHHWRRARELGNDSDSDSDF